MNSSSSAGESGFYSTVIWYLMLLLSELWVVQSQSVLPHQNLTQLMYNQPSAHSVLNHHHCGTDIFMFSYYFSWEFWSPENKKYEDVSSLKTTLSMPMLCLHSFPHLEKPNKEKPSKRHLKHGYIRLHPSWKYLWLTGLQAGWNKLRYTAWRCNKINSIQLFTMLIVNSYLTSTCMSP